MSLSTSNFRVVEVLKERKGAEMSVEEIEETTGIPIRSNSELLERLKGNPFLPCREVDLEDGSKGLYFRYLNSYGFNNLEGFKAHLQKVGVFEPDSELRRTYNRFDEDVETLVREGSILVVKPEKSKRTLYFWNEAPQYRPVAEHVRELWHRSLDETKSNIVEIQTQLSTKFGEELAKLEFDEDDYFQAQRREKNMRIQRRKQMRKPRGRPKTKNTASQSAGFGDFDISLTVTEENVNLWERDETEIQDEEELDNFDAEMRIPIVPPEVCDFVREIIRLFYEDSCAVGVDGLLRVSTSGEAVKMEERREGLLAERLLLPPRYLRTIFGKLSKHHLTREQQIVLPVPETAPKGTKRDKASCWLITFNNFFDVVNYRLHIMRNTIEKEGKEQANVMYLCQNASCGATYTMENVQELFFNNNTCLRCGSEVAEPATTTRTDGWGDTLDVIARLRKQLFNILTSRSKDKSGGQGTGPGGRKVPSSRRGKRTPGPQTPRTPSTRTPGSKALPAGGGEGVVGSASGNGETAATLERVKKVAFDDPHPVIVGREGLLYLNISRKNWTKPREARKRKESATQPKGKSTKLLRSEGESDQVRVHPEGEKANLQGDVTGPATKGPSSSSSLSSSQNGASHAGLMAVKKEPKDSDFVQPMELGTTATADGPSTSGSNGASTAAVKQEDGETAKQLQQLIKKEVTVHKEEELLMDRLQEKRRRREEGWEWSHSTRKAYDFLCIVAALRCYHSQYEITEESLFLARKHKGITNQQILDRLLFFTGLLHVSQLPRRLATLFLNPADDEYFDVRVCLRGRKYHVETRSPTILHQVSTGYPVVSSEVDGAPMYSTQLDNTLKMLELKRIVTNSGRTIIEEHDFLNNRYTTDSSDILDISLKPGSSARDYQKRAAFSPFWDNKVHSSILVLPCGAGKTLVGITVSSIVKQCVIVFCTSMMAVNQWREQFLKWSTVEPSAISRFIASTKRAGEWNSQCGVLITTYNMFSRIGQGNRSAASSVMINKCRERTWGLMILDEVHLAPAKIFRRVTTEFRAQCKLGLTATMVREDELIVELPELVGPKLDEVDLLGLKMNNHVAKVQCYRITCPLTQQFQQAYNRANSPEERRLLFICNPMKARIVFNLVMRHIRKRHKILVFCDDLFGLGWFAHVFKTPFVDGSTPQDIRESCLRKFRAAQGGTYLLISKVGDHSIDLPEANVVIQVGVVDGSRMQEAQRLGRIQRKKSGEGNETAYFYAIISDGTEEVDYSRRRKVFMEEHGYLYHDIDYRHFLFQETEELASSSIQELFLEKIQAHLLSSDNHDVTDELAEDRGNKTKKKGTSRQRLQKKVNPSRRGRAAVDDAEI